jgi:hypothetical protein
MRAADSGDKIGSPKALDIEDTVCAAGAATPGSIKVMNRQTA